MRTDPSVADMKDEGVDKSARPFNRQVLCASPEQMVALPEGFMDLVGAIGILLKIDRRLNPEDYKPLSDRIIRLTV